MRLYNVLELDLKVDCGGIGDGSADDAIALRECLIKLASPTEGRPERLRIPVGLYRISGSAGQMPILPHGVTISGDGSFASVLVLDKSFSGNLFSWSESWGGRVYGSTSIDVRHDASGPSVTGLKIVGTREAFARQAALTFYDRNDFVLLRDLELDYINGPCVSIGQTLNMPLAYMRESSFYNVKCWNSGSAAEPAVEIGSTTTDGSDATNELDFYKLAIFAAKNVGLSIRNPNPYSATRKLRFFGLRVEQSGGDDVQIAPAGDKGQVAEVDFYDLSVLTSGAVLGPGNKTGIEIDNGRLIDIELSGLDAPVVLGPGAGADISIHGNGSEYDWTFQGTRKPGEEAVPLNLRAPYGLYGLPNAGGRIGAAALKGQSVDGQPVRLTMDGKPADAYNCFNPSYAQAFNLDIQVMAVDHAAPDRFYAWRMPLAVLSAWSGAGSAKLQAAEPLTRGVAGASVAAAADQRDGCLDLTFTPPAGAGAWDVTAAIHFARAP